MYAGRLVQFLFAHAKRKPKEIQTRSLLTIFVSASSPLVLYTDLLPFSGRWYVNSHGNAFCSEISSMNCFKIHTISSFYFFLHKNNNSNAKKIFNYKTKLLLLKNMFQRELYNVGKRIWGWILAVSGDKLGRGHLRNDLWKIGTGQQHFIANSKIN